MNTVQQTFTAPDTGKTRKVQVVVTRTQDLGEAEWELMRDITARVNRWFTDTAESARPDRRPRAKAHADGERG